MTDPQHQWQQYEEKISSVQSLPELEALELELFGRKQGKLNDALKALGSLPPDARKEKGQELNAIKMTLMARIEGKRTDLTAGSLGRLAADDPLDVTLSLPMQDDGHLHLIPEFIRSIEEIFGRMGFDVAHGNEIETEEMNFDMLNIPADHPARDAHDTFFIAEQKGYVLRTHTSPVQIHYMRSVAPPFRMICLGKVYRKDLDATHSPMFHQLEGLMVGEDVSLANMKAVMITAIEELLSPNIEFRFRTSYFPFVEPGLEVDMRWKHQQGEAASRWLEVAGCGMVHPTVLKNGGVDPLKYQGFAFGFGIERLLMIKHKIPDLRMFYQGDLRFLRQF